MAANLSKNETAGQEVWRSLLLVSDLFRTVSAHEAPRKDLNRITVNQVRILGYLFRRRIDGRPVRIKTLAHDLDVTPAAASQAVERLVGWGVVERTPDPDDRRAVRLSFTPRGEALVHRQEQRATELLESLAGVCPPEDFAAFGRVLVRLMGELESRWESILAEKDARKRGKRADAGAGKTI
jgi:DNA-binding MarR family transcriptional regulator